jgi:hypothetical protein
MSLAIRDTSVVPPESWIYLVEQTGVLITTKNYAMLYPLVVQHCQSNNVPVPSQQDVVNYICKEAHVPCFDRETHQPLINKFTLGLPNPISSGCCGKILPDL